MLQIYLCARENALAWENFFRNDLQISQVVTLLDENATKEEILYQAEELKNKTDSNSNIWMVFIGHGAPSPTGNHGVLIGVDAQQTARGLASRSIPIPELISIWKTHHLNNKSRLLMPVLVGCPTTVTHWHQGYNLLYYQRSSAKSRLCHNRSTRQSVCRSLTRGKSSCI